MHALGAVQAQLAQRDASIEPLRYEVERVRQELQTHQQEATAVRQVLRLDLFLPKPMCILQNHLFRTRH